MLRIVNTEDWFIADLPDREQEVTFDKLTIEEYPNEYECLKEWLKKYVALDSRVMLYGWQKSILLAIVCGILKASDALEMGS